MANQARKKVFVGMSGGVDSSVSAALLEAQGYDVVGVFIRAWEPEGFACGWREERRDAMRVAATLDIPFTTLNLAETYKREVIDQMISEYRLGRTPNPDVVCNQAIKFGAFFRAARAGGADYIATGHYARVERGKGGRAILKAGLDQEKDQSYFLWTLGQEELSRTLFPVGAYQKSEVRALAEKFNLPVFNKKDSQGLCFIGKLNVKEFLADYIKAEKGHVLDTSGHVIGTHQGAIFYTLGERHGFDITHQSPATEPLYVIAKDMTTNTITVSPQAKQKTMSGETVIQLENLNWVSGRTPSPDQTYSGRVRYRQPLVSCQITAADQRALVLFSEAVGPAAPGQSLVLYDGETCLGGGIIV